MPLYSGMEQKYRKIMFDYELIIFRLTNQNMDPSSWKQTLCGKLVSKAAGWPR